MTAVRSRRIAFVLAVLGCAIAGYLTYVHYAGVAPVCAIGHGCETVQHSRYAEVLGAPVALAGLATYAGILLGVLVDRGGARMVVATLALVGAGFSVYLTYLELAVIHAICPWCVASAVIMVMLAAVGLYRILAAPPGATPATSGEVDVRSGLFGIPGR